MFAINKRVFGFFFKVAFLFSVRKRKINTLKPSYFVPSVVGLFAGFPRHKRVIDGFVRCLMCKADNSITGRGLGNLWGHWKSAEHTRLEQKFRIMTQRPLPDKSCRPVSVEEDRRIRLARKTEPLVYLESTLSLSVEERIAMEEAAAASLARPVVSGESANYLWSSYFINCFAMVTDFRGLIQMQDRWTVTMRIEFDLAERSLTCANCQVSIFRFIPCTVSLLVVIG